MSGQQRDRLQREHLLAATGKLLAPIAARVRSGKLAGAAAVGTKADEVLGKYKMAKHFKVTITDTSLAIERKRARIEEEARLDGSTSSAPPSQAPTSARQRDNCPYRSFRGLLAHLGSLTRDELRFAGTPATVPVPSEPTSDQRQAFELIGGGHPDHPAHVASNPRAARRENAGQRRSRHPNHL